MFRRTLAVAGLVGILSLGGCVVETNLGGGLYSFTRDGKTTYKTFSVRQSDGSYITRYPRDAEVQRVLKSAMRKNISREALEFLPDGTIKDVRYLRIFPDGSGTFEFYENR